MTMLVLGNWKMNGSRELLRAQLSELNALETGSVEVAIFPPNLFLEAGAAAAGKCSVGAQNCASRLTGSQTGEVSASMLKDAGASHVIVGHSERRQHLQEDDKTVGRKAALTCDAGLVPVVCIGENLEEYEQKQARNVLDRQLSALLGEVIDFASLVVAYEPVWAIGTGKVPTLPEIDEQLGWIRNWLVAHIGGKLGARPVLVYGGSVNEGNAREILKLPNVQGVLVGGASLNRSAFRDIVEHAVAVTSAGDD